MAGHVYTVYVVEKLRQNVHMPSRFRQVYAKLNLTDTDFLIKVISMCAERYKNSSYVDYVKVFVKIILMEHSNVSLVSKAFEMLLRSNNEHMIKCVIQNRWLQGDDGGSEVCLCQSVVKTMWLYWEAGFRLLTDFSDYHKKTDHPSLSCILQRLLAMILTKTDSAKRLKCLDTWLRNGKMTTYSRTVNYATDKGCSYFKDEVQSSVLTTQVQWCFNNGLECVAVYMLFLYQNYNGIAQFINDYASEISELPKFITMLSLYPAIAHNALDVTLALFNLYEKHDQPESLCTYFYRIESIHSITESQWQALMNECQQKGYKKWTMYLCLERCDWESLARQAQTCGDPVLVDNAIRLTHDIYYMTSTSYNCKALLESSSKNPRIVAIVLLGAIKHGDISMVSKLLDEGYRIDTKFFFTSWQNVYYEILFPPGFFEHDREDDRREMGYVVIKKGLLCQFCHWLEENNLITCTVKSCKGCMTCIVHRLIGKVLDRDMPNLLRLLLTSGSVPSVSVHQTIQNIKKIQKLSTISRDCVAMLISFQGSCHHLQNLTAFIFSRQINSFPRKR